MNKQRRKELEKIGEELALLYERLESVIGEEREGFENLPEGLQNGERGESMTANADQMDEALSSIDEAKTAIEEVATR